MAMTDLATDVSIFYRYVVTHLVPGPLSISYFVPIFLLPIALLFPPEIISHRQLILYILPIIYSCTIHAWYAMGGVDVITVDVLLWSTYLIAFTDPRKEFRRIRRTAVVPKLTSNGFSGKRKEKVPESRPKPLEEYEVHDESYPAGYLERILWVVDLSASYRLVDWKIGSASHDHRQATRLPRTSRLRCALNILPLAVTDVLLFWLVTFAARDDPFYTTPTISISSPYIKTPSYSITAALHVLPPQILRSLTIGAYAFAVVSYHLSVVPTVFALLSNYLIALPPDRWSYHTLPPLFGSFSAVFTHGLRGFWGQFWHQTMRAFNSAPGVFLADWLGLPRRSKRRYALQIVSAFFFSGVCHMGLVPCMASDANRLRLATAAFFWAQAVGIGVEVAVEAAMSAVSPSATGLWRHRTARVLRLLWAVAWLATTAQLLGPVSRGLGYWKVLPYSLSLDWRTWMPLSPIPLWPLWLL